MPNPNAQAELKSIVRGFRRGILQGNSSFLMCLAVCAPLQSLLKMYGYETALEEIDFGFSNHYWLRLPDGRIIDPTADQFRGARLPQVYIGPVPAKFQRWIAYAQSDAKPQCKAAC